MDTPEKTHNLFIRTYRRVKSRFPIKDGRTEHDCRMLTEEVLEDVYQDIVAKMCDQLEQLDVRTMQPVTLHIEVPGHGPKYLKVNVLELDELLSQIAGKLRSTGLRPYRAYEE